MMIGKRPNTAIAIACASTLGLALLAPSQARADDKNLSIKHVLLLSLDGMHEVDLQRYVKFHPASAFAKLLARSVHFTTAHTARPSDSFPGLLAFMTGASPRTHGVFSDDSYDRTLFAPKSDCQGTPGNEVVYDESIDYDLTKLDGGGAAGSNHIDPAQLPMR